MTQLVLTSNVKFKNNYSLQKKQLKIVRITKILFEQFVRIT